MISTSDAFSIGKSHLTVMLVAQICIFQLLLRMKVLVCTLTSIVLYKNVEGLLHLLLKCGSLLVNVQ